jgi:hypothetical protein
VYDSLKLLNVAFEGVKIHCILLDKLKFHNEVERRKLRVKTLTTDFTNFTDFKANSGSMYGKKSPLTQMDTDLMDKNR